MAEEQKSDELKTWVFPAIDKASCLISREKKTAWIGIPLTASDPVSIICFLDAMKINVVEAWSEARSPIVRPVNGVTGLMRKAGIIR